MTLNQIVYNIRNIIRAGKGSTNDDMSIEQIKFWVSYYRATFIRRDVDKNHFVQRHFEQDLGAIKLIIADPSEVSSIVTGDRVLRSNVKIPDTVRLKDRDGITFLGGMDKRTPIPLITVDMGYWGSFSKYGKNATKAFILNNYIYIINNLDLDYINVRGIFEDPEQVKGFKDENDCDCYTDDMKYPIPADYVEGITSAILKTESTMFLQGKTDNNQNLIQD